MFFLKKKTACNLGFTMVEVMLAITIVGIVAAITVGAINQESQRKRAHDAVNRTRLEDLSMAIEAYYGAEGRYPDENMGVPDSANDPAINTYVNTSAWPVDFSYRVSNANDDFAVYVPQSDGSFMKYSTSWGTVETCLETGIDVIDVCIKSAPSSGVTLSRIEVEPEAASLSVSQTLQLEAFAVYSDDSRIDVTYDPDTTWQCTDAACASAIDLGGNGNLTALVSGIAIAEAEYRGQTDTTTITVLSLGPATTLTGLVVTPDNPSIPTGGNVQMTAIAQYSDGSTTNVTSDPSISWQISSGGENATVSASGLVSGTAAGTATVRVVATYQGYSDDAEIIVNSIAAKKTLTSLVVSPSTFYLNGDSTRQLRATVTFSDGSFEDVTTQSSWQSTDRDVATVSLTGLVTGVSSGRTTIRVSYPYGASTMSAISSVRVLEVADNFCTEDAECKDYRCSFGCPYCNVFRRTCECSTNCVF